MDTGPVIHCLSIPDGRKVKGDYLAIKEITESVRKFPRAFSAKLDSMLQSNFTIRFLSGAAVVDVMLSLYFQTMSFGKNPK